MFNEKDKREMQIIDALLNDIIFIHFAMIYFILFSHEYFYLIKMMEQSNKQ